MRFVSAPRTNLVRGAATRPPVRGSARSFNGGLEDSVAISVSAITLTFVPGTVYIMGFATASLSAPAAYQFNASGRSLSPNAFNGTLPQFTLRAFSGAQAALSLPKFTLTATATGVGMGRATLTMPTATLIANGRTGAAGAAFLRMPAFTLRAHFGGQARLAFAGTYSLNGTGKVSAIGRVRAIMPLYTLAASATAQPYARAALKMPMLRPVPSAIARLVLQNFTLVATGSVVVTYTATDYEAYAINLRGESLHAATRYTNFPFAQIVRLENKYYGVASDGLYELTGDVDVTAVIPWEMRTHESDMNTKNFKRVLSAYIGGRVDKGAIFTIYSGESRNKSKAFPMPVIVGAKTARAKTPKGLKSRYLSYGVSDPAGGSAEVATLDIEIQQMGRSI